MWKQDYIKSYRDITEAAPQFTLTDEDDTDVAFKDIDVENKDILVAD